MDKSSLVGIDLQTTGPQPWAVVLDGPNQDQMRKRLSKIEDPHARNRVFSTAAEVLGQCPHPASKTGSVTGLALGKVQSGKTSSFITVAAQAFDNGYKVTVVLAGTKNNLLRQNTKRIKKDLTTGRAMEVAIKTTEAGSAVAKENILQLINANRPVVITALKHFKHINDLADLFEHPDLARLPVLIIDDEGDQASLNTRTGKKRASQTGGKSSTYKAILRLRSTLKLHAYVAYTATPQANLLINTLDELSPQFCVLVEPGPGYTGGSTFHGPDRERYTRKIGDGEEFNDTSGIPETFQTALATFFVGSVVRRLRFDMDFHSLLIHTSHRKSDHQVVTERVEAVRRHWESALRLPTGDPAREDILTLLHKGYVDLTKSVAAMPAWPEIAASLLEAIANCTVWMVNSADDGQEVPEEEEDYDFRNNIFIGGNLLDRGVTVPGLAVTYITRWAAENQADTVEQRARWFGYKLDYLDVCRIWAPQPVLEGFAALLGHEDALWASLRKWRTTGQGVKQWRRLLILNDPSLIPTRRSVASYREVKLEEDWITQLRPAADVASAAANVESVRRFFDFVGAKPRSYGNQTHLSADKVSLKILQQQLLDKLVQADPQWSAGYLVQFFEMVKGIFNLDEIDVLWIKTFESKGKAANRTRTLKADGSLSSLLQGSNEPKYPGDKGLAQGRAMVQVHTPDLKNRKEGQAETVVLLAIYLPGLKDLDEKTLRLVRGNE